MIKLTCLMSSCCGIGSARCHMQFQAQLDDILADAISFAADPYMLRQKSFLKLSSGKDC